MHQTQKNVNKICVSNLARNAKIIQIPRMNENIKITIGEVVRRLRKSKKITLTQLADKMGGYDSGNLSRFERGKQEIGADKLETIAEVLETTVANIYLFAEYGGIDILSGFEDIRNTPKAIQSEATMLDWPDILQTKVEPVSTVRYAPLLTLVQAGAFCDSGQDVPIDDSGIFYPCPASEAGPRTFSAKVVGDSMTSEVGRSYPSGMIIFVDPDATPSPGTRVIARVGGETTFKQLAEGENGKWHLEPLNKRFPIIFPKENEEIHICGVVVGSYSPE